MLGFLIAAVVLTGVAAWTDYRTGLMPNWLTLGALPAAIVAHFAYGWYNADLSTGLSEAAYAFAGALFCSVGPGFMYWKGGMGGGDLKLFAALGALCQPMLGIEVQAYAFVIAAIIAPARLAYEGKLFQVLGASLSLVVNPLRQKENRREVPSEMLTWFRLGPAIFAATLISLLLRGYAASP